MTEPTIRLDAVPTDRLTEEDLRALRALFDAAWSGDEAFDDDDWAHTMGGMHFVVRARDGDVLSHASVVERTLETAGLWLRTGYVEGVATLAKHRGAGLASRAMRAVGSFIDGRYELGALGTGLFAFYERLGWERWLGPTSVRTQRGLLPTPDEDGSVMVRRTPTTPVLDLDAPLACDWRSGDVW